MLGSEASRHRWRDLGAASYSHSLSRGAIVPTISNEIEVFGLNHLHDLTALARDQLIANEMRFLPANVLKVCDIRNKIEVFGLDHLSAANAPTLPKRDRHRNAGFFPLRC